MIAVCLFIGVYVLLAWGFAVLAHESCWLCGARPHTDFGCFCCKRKGDPPEEDHNDLTVA